MKSTSSTATQLFNDKTEDLLNEGKTLASTIYEQSVDTLNNVEDSVKEYSEKLVEGVK